MFELPDIQGDLPQHKYIIYFSCDDIYYHKYGIPLIKSIVNQIPWINVHCHVMLRNKVIFYTHSQVSYSYENITEEFIQTIPNAKITKYGQQKDKLIVYYSCARFMQIEKLFKKNQHILQVDCDSLLFRPFKKDEFESLTSTVKCMRKPKSPEKVIASALSLGTGEKGQSFREQLSDKLYKKISDYGAYWFVDQDVLQDIFNNSNYTDMPLLWNTWSLKKKDAYFRTGKGNKKESTLFQIELEKWKGTTYGKKLP